MLVEVLIPVYRTELSPDEMRALNNNATILSRYRLTLLAPEGLDISGIIAQFPTLGVRRVSNDWLGSKNGIAGYNAMMLSAEFYKLFDDVDYILICHTDAWIFSDELQAWCEAGYDCVAAPWIQREFYSWPVVKQYFALQYWLQRMLGAGDTRQKIYNKIGNGGLSLRRVAAFTEGCVRYKNEIKVYLHNSHHLFNEDVFWATVPTTFNYPNVKTALAFAFDTNPKYCYRQRGGQLPFGCHSWSKPRMWRFWREIIKA